MILCILKLKQKSWSNLLSDLQLQPVLSLQTCQPHPDHVRNRKHRLVRRSLLIRLIHNEHKVVQQFSRSYLEGLLVHIQYINNRSWHLSFCTQALTDAPLGPGNPMTPGCPRAPCGPGGPGRPSSPEPPWSSKVPFSSTLCLQMKTFSPM